MKDQNWYQTIFKYSPLGYAYHKIIINQCGIPIDYEFIDINPSFTKITGLKRSALIGKKATEIFTSFQNDISDWIASCGDVALNKTKWESTYFSEHTHRFYKVDVFAGEKSHFIISYAELSDLIDPLVDHDLEGLSAQSIIRNVKMIETELKENKRQLIEANELLQKVLDTIPMPIFWKDRNSAFLGCNLLFALDAGKQSPVELIGNTDYDLAWKEQAASYIKDDLEIISSGIPRINIEEPHTSANGIVSWVRTTKVPLRDADDKILGLLGTYEDITKRKVAEQELHYEKQRLLITLHSIGDGVITTDSKGRVLLVNSIAEALIGWSQEQAQGRHIGEIFYIVNEQTRIPCDNPVDMVMKTGKVIGLANHMVLISKDGSEYAIDDSAAPIMSEEGCIEGVVLVFRNVTEKRKKENEIVYLSYHDVLTGLYNRRFFEDQLKRMNLQEKLPISIIMGDVNGLKFTNDVFGHEEGDKLLKSSAEIIKGACRPQDIIARWGGDEFIILLPNTPEKFAEDISRNINAKCSIGDEKAIHTSISIGYATKEDIEQSMEKVLKSAEDGMYRQKFLESRSYRSSIVSSIKKSLYEKSHETEEHAERIKLVSRKIGSVIGLSGKDLYELELVAVLHDIGKIAIMDSVLNKPGTLTAEEWIEMKRHSEIGYRIAQSVPELAQIAEYILAHHERWDGKGYPRGLVGDDIPMMSRIIAVADSFDAMISERLYKKAMSENEAIQEIIRNSGTQFDPKVVTKFLSTIGR